MLLLHFPKGSGSGGVREATAIVAASNSVHKNEADYVCDGTDDQVEIQSAIDSLPTTGGSVYLMEGRYNINGQITITKDNVTILGSGQGSWLRLIDGYNANFTMFHIQDKNHVKISGLKLDGNRSNNTSGSMSAVRIYDSHICTIDNCYIHSWRDCCIKTGRVSTRPTKGFIFNNHIGDCGDGSMNTCILVREANEFVIQGNNLHTAGRLIYLSMSDKTMICNNTFYGTATRGIVLDESSRTTISNNCFENVDDALGTGTGGYVRFNDLVFSNNICYNLWGGLCLLGDIANACRSLVCEGNTFIDINMYGIRLTNGSDCIIANNTFKNIGLGNNNSYDAVELNHVVRSVIANNTVSSYNVTNIIRYGVNENTSDCNYNEVIGNVILNYGTSAIRLQGANSEEAHNIY